MTKSAHPTGAHSSLLYREGTAKSGGAGEELLASARYGIAASLACTKKGAQPSVPRAEEIAGFLRR